MKLLGLQVDHLALNKLKGNAFFPEDPIELFRELSDPCDRPIPGLAGIVDIEVNRDPKSFQYIARFRRLRWLAPR
jgi:hypothetical protein